MSRPVYTRKVTSTPSQSRAPRKGEQEGGTWHMCSRAFVRSHMLFRLCGFLSTETCLFPFTSCPTHLCLSYSPAPGATQAPAPPVPANGTMGLGPLPAVTSRLWTFCTCVLRAAGRRALRTEARRHSEPGTPRGPHCDRAPGAVGADAAPCAHLTEAPRSVSVRPPCFDAFEPGPGTLPRDRKSVV